MSRPFHKLLLATTALLCTATGLAQSGAAPKTASLGEARVGAKLLTMEELRSCLKQRTELGQRKPTLEAAQAQLDRERQELTQLDATLKTERAKIDKLGETADELSRRSKELSQQVADFNERMSRFNAMPPSGPTGERQRRSLEREQATIDKATQDLQAQRAALGPHAEQMVKTYRARAISYDEAAADWNARNAKLTATSSAYQNDLQDWSADCAGRPYREDDEKAIQAGQ